MPYRQRVARQLADTFKVIAHPDRIRLIEELRNSEHDVGSLASLLSITPARISQHLSLLKAHRLVRERRAGRHHFYRLTQPDLARWLVEGIDIVSPQNPVLEPAEIRTVKRQWAGAAA